MTPESDIHKFLAWHKSKGIAPLAVQFPNGWAPFGVFCCSVCHLQSHFHWNVDQSPISSTKDTPQPPPISRNSITFTKCGRQGSVTLIDNFAFCTVCLNVDKGKIKEKNLVKLCHAVKTELFAAVKAGLENTHHKHFSQMPVFLCPHDDCSTDLHTADLSVGCEQWICSEYSHKYGNLEPNQTLWFSELGES